MKPPKEHQPLRGVHDATIYRVLDKRRTDQSWFDACNALVAAGWTAPPGHPLAK